MARRVVSLIVALALSPVAASAQADLSREDYDRLKSGAVQVMQARFAARQEQALEFALTRRGHAGDRTLLMGCDLSAPEDVAEAAHLERVIASPDHEAYVAAETRLKAVHVIVARAVPPPAQAADPDVSAWLAQAFAVDQRMRSTSPPTLPTALTDLQPVADTAWLDAICRMDLIHGAILRDVIGSLPPTLEPSDNRLLFTLLMHADHDPRLQALGAAHFRSLAGPDPRYVVFQSRLTDRSELNFGRHQVYGQLYQCDAPLRPSGPRTDPAEIDRNRAEIGLPTFLDQASKACATGPSQ